MAKKQKAESNKPEFATKAQFDKLEDALAKIADAVIEIKNRPVAAVAETKEEKEVKAAGPNRVDTNPIWDGVAREVLGDYLDHTEVEYGKSGAVNFTIVIKKDKSNAQEAYLSLTKTDRRTKEVSAEGMEGVTSWCKLVRQNLKRTEKLGVN